MKYKWIAVLLACALLLCGCRQTKEDWLISDGIAGQTTVTSLSDVTTKRTAGTTVSPIAPPPSRAIVSCDGCLRPKEQGFTLEAYKSALSSVRTAEEIEDLFKDADHPKKATDDNFKMLLHDRFFLVPILKDGALTTVTLAVQGNTSFTLQLPDRCSLSIIIYHRDINFGGLEGTEFTTADGRSVFHEHKTNKAEVFCMEVEGYRIEIYGFDVCGCKQSYVENLTFEKVEIE